MIKFLKENLDNLFIACLVIFLYSVSSALTPFFIGITISYIALPIMSYITAKCKVSRVTSIIIAVLIVYILLIASIMFFIPFLYDRLYQIVNSLMSLNLESVKINNELYTLLINLKDMVIAKIPGYVTSLIQTIISSTQSLISLIFSLIFAPLIAIYFLKDIQPSRHKIIIYLNNLAENFIKVQLLVILFYTLCYFILLSWLKINETITLSIICGILYILPYIGPITGCIISCLMAAVQYGFDFHIVALIVSFLVINIIDILLISPRFIGNKFGLHPLMTIFSLLITSYLFGFVGMIFAIPIAVLIKDSYKQIFRH